jgi:hypothetical protein
MRSWMKTLALMLAVVPTLAMAAPQGPPAGRGAGPDEAQRAEYMQKRMRLARTLGLAEALDLDEAGALKLRDTMARFDERRAPVAKQIRESMRVLHDAARGDKAAAGQVDAAIKRLREGRSQMLTLQAEMLGQITQGLSPERKARAALFLGRFHERAGRMMPRDECPACWHGRGKGMGPGRPGRGRGGMGMGPDLNGAPPLERQAMGPQGPDDDGQGWFADD